MFDPDISRRRALALAGVAALTGCGFSPALGTTGSAQKLRNAVQIDGPDSVAGFDLAAQLETRFGPVATPRYRLQVGMSQAQSPAAINADGDTTRFNVRAQAPWTLNDVTGAVLLSGTARSFASYAATGSTVTTQAAASDARRRLAIGLADLIASDITARAATLP